MNLSPFASQCALRTGYAFDIEEILSDVEAGYIPSTIEAVKEAKARKDDEATCLHRSYRSLQFSPKVPLF